MILPLLLALSCGPGPDGFGLWELQLYKPYNETQPTIVQRIKTTPGGAPRYEVTAPGRIRVCASIRTALDDLAEASEVRKVVWLPESAPARKEMDEEADRLRKGNVVLRSHTVALATVEADLLCATRALEAGARRQDRHCASKTWRKPWTLLYRCPKTRRRVRPCIHLIDELSCSPLKEQVP